MNPDRRTVAYVVEGDLYLMEFFTDKLKLLADDCGVYVKKMVVADGIHRLTVYRTSQRRFISKEALL